MSSIAKFDVEKFICSNDFGLWRVKMRCLLLNMVGRLRQILSQKP